MSKRFICDALRCTNGATWHGFGGKSHFCDVHKPDAESERLEGERVPGLGAWKSNSELLGLDIKPRRKQP